MFENFGTAIVQAIGFFGVFGFFVYRLLSEKDFGNPVNKNSKINPINSSKKLNTQKKTFFGRNKKIDENKEPVKKEDKKGWFKR
tara:strand:- start:421 stop:672 length:252 start_codon:yes stop_codon:yes gene_type:complete